MPLPATRFEPAVWKQATVQFNYHVAADKMYYSVPYQYIRDKVDVRLTGQTVEIFYNNERIASHKRLYGRPGQYSTVREHMPKDHQQYLEWNGDRFRRWVIMTKYREILRLKSLGFRDRNIARSCSVSRNTVSFGMMLAAPPHSNTILISIDRTDDFQETGQALSAHRNIQPDMCGNPVTFKENLYSFFCCPDIHSLADQII